MPVILLSSWIEARIFHIVRKALLCPTFFAMYDCASSLYKMTQFALTGGAFFSFFNKTTQEFSPLWLTLVIYLILGSHRMSANIISTTINAFFSRELIHMISVLPDYTIEIAQCIWSKKMKREWSDPQYTHAFLKTWKTQVHLPKTKWNATFSSFS